MKVSRGVAVAAAAVVVAGVGWWGAQGAAMAARAGASGERQAVAAVAVSAVVLVLACLAVLTVRARVAWVRLRTQVEGSAPAWRAEGRGGVVVVAAALLGFFVMAGLAMLQVHDEAARARGCGGGV